MQLMKQSPQALGLRQQTRLSAQSLKPAARLQRSVVVRAEGEGPKKLEDIPPAERKFSDQQWDNAIKSASQASSPQAPQQAKPVSLGEAFAFSGPLPEKANGRLSMLGFVAALGAELATGEPVFTQFNEATGPIIGAVVLFTVASLVPMLKGSDSPGVGPFTPQAEQTNGRFAMIGIASLLAYEALQGSALF